MKIFIASDHGGFNLKQTLIDDLSKDYEVIDLGTNTGDSVDYPDYADQLAEALGDRSLSSENDFGILLCGSGQGVAMRANRYPHIRAALVWNEEIARLAREHNNANVLCLSGRFLEPQAAINLTRLFLTTAFAGGRHQRRVDKLSRKVES